MNTCDGLRGCTPFSHDPHCARSYPDQPLASWERELLRRPHREGEANVTFTRTDGSTFTVEDVRVDSVGPSAEAKGVVGVEFYSSDRVIHVPFVQSWEFEYRY